MTATVTIMQQYLEVADVGDVIVTDTQQSDEGDYVRDIRIFSRATADEETGQLVVQVRIRGMTREVLELTAPPQQF
jgi:hypothetical protein